VPLEVAIVPTVVVSVLMNTASAAEAAIVCGGRESFVEVAKLLQGLKYRVQGFYQCCGYRYESRSGSGRIRIILSDLDMDRDRQACLSGSDRSGLVSMPGM
jgi:hypothetical protein